MAFALVAWDGVLELSGDLLENARSTLARLTNFHDLAEGYLSSGQATDVHRYNEADWIFAGQIRHRSEPGSARSADRSQISALFRDDQRSTDSKSSKSFNM
jgi:hypothetical protein